MSPVEYYQKMIESGEIINDPNQWIVVAKLQVLYERINKVEQPRGLLKKLKDFVIKREETEKGLYIWGTVGAGKTFLMNAFYYGLSIPQKQRWHYVDFMAEVHQRLKILQGDANPLTELAKNLADKYRVMCLDEFIVTEIADAMILGRLLRELIKKNVILILTSNVEPAQLYKNGLQYEQFLPTIELIEKRFEIIQLSLEQDYRRRYHGLQNFLFPEDKSALQEMEKRFEELAQGHSINYNPLIIAEHKLTVKKRVNRVVWFDFSQLCYPPRSQFDYLEIVNQFDTIMISHLKPILPYQHDIVRLFIKLIDVIYDHHKKLIISSNVPIDAIYIDGILSPEFARTKSRLIELAANDRG